MKKPAKIGGLTLCGEVLGLGAGPGRLSADMVITDAIPHEHGLDAYDLTTDKFLNSICCGARRSG